MKKIINEETRNVVLLSTITDNSIVGIIGVKEKYLIVPKLNSGIYTYTRMDDRLTVLGAGKSSIQELLKSITYREAFEFNTKKESIDWLLDQ